MGLYRIEAPMEQALAMADVLVKAEQLAAALEHLRGFKDLDKYWIEIHRLENDGDRLYRDAVASLFANGIDPMFVIRWRDIFLRLEQAVGDRDRCPHPRRHRHQKRMRRAEACASLCPRLVGSLTYDRCTLTSPTSLRP